MADLADAFAALPGGFGTGDELLEMLTWAQLGIHAKPLAVLNVAGYFDSLLAWLDRGVRDGFVTPENRGLLREIDSVENLLPLLFKQAR
jgi:uncharacterized protein (TIGR00730 family)